MMVDENFDGNFHGNFDGNLMGILMEILMMDSMRWPYDSSDCLLYLSISVMWIQSPIFCLTKISLTNLYAG